MLLLCLGKEQQQLGSSASYCCRCAYRAKDYAEQHKVPSLIGVETHQK